MAAETSVAFDPMLFAEASIPPAVAKLNAEIVARQSAAPDMWNFTAAEIRAARAAGKGFFPLQPKDPDAEDRIITGPGGPLRLRIVRPKTRSERGVYLHLHGGGWMIGSPEENDARLRRHAENTGLASISVDYRLAPEHPYPAAADDCEAAALWLLSDAAAGFNLDFLAIGGESAGAHLSVVTMLRLRDRHGTMPFLAANLVAGIYDLAMTPSVRNWGEEKLILTTRDVTRMIAGFAGDADVASPDLSPLHADLSGLPPALVTCGTKDLLLDDSLFIAARLASSAVPAELAVYPGGCHVFQNFATRESQQSLSQMDGFLNRRIDEASA